MRDRRWEMGENAYVHAMCVQEERKGPSSALNWVGCATLSVFFLILKYDLFHKIHD